MIKYFSALFLSSLITATSAQTIDIPVPFAPGGHFSTFVPLTAEDLNKRGWKTSVKFLGKCGVAKEQFTNAEQPTMTVWATNWISSVDNTCFLDVNKDNLVDIYMQAPLYVCGPIDNPTWTPVAGKTYTIGVNNSVLKEEFTALEEYAKKLGIKFKIVTYQNSTSVRTAHVAKELDMIFSSVGLEQQKTRQTRCLVTSATNPVENINTIWNETGIKPVTPWVGFLIMNSRGMSKERFEQLRSDTRDIIATNPDIRSHMNNKYIIGYPGSIQEQLKFIQGK